MQTGRVLLLGGGNMGGAMARGWLDAGLPADALSVVDPKGGPHVDALVARGVAHRATPEGLSAAIVVVAVKPQVLDEALVALRPVVRADTLVVSVVAGRTIASLRAGLGECLLVRAMPNTPALIGRGITGAFADGTVAADRRATAERLLAASGPVEWVGSEAEIDAVTAVSGSGPAYVFHLAEALAAAGVKAGLEPALAMRLARHTIAGAGELMIRANETPETLRRNVTSPNGTTQAALAVLMAADGLAPLMERAVEAARARAAELAES